MDPSLIILCLSLTLQTIAATIALRLYIIKKQRLAGTLMLLAVLLMVFRRFLSLYLLFEDGDGGLDLASEISACAVSFILVVGFLYVGRRATPLRTR
jgi:hypothetical protein